MKITHFAGRKRTVDSESGAFMLSDKKGGFAVLAQNPRSRYDGLFFKKGMEIFKSLESIWPQGKPVEIENRLSHIIIKRDSGLKETFWMPEGKSAMIYELNKQSDITLAFDCKKIFENDEFGREYLISKEKGCIIISFSQKKESGVDNVFTAVHGKGLKYQPVEKWVEHYYELDHKRQSWPWSRWVFEACRIRGAGFAIASSTSRKDAINCALNVFKNRELLKRREQKNAKNTIKSTKASNPEFQAALSSAANAIKNLSAGEDSSYAGIPWFAQYWTRDELISTRGMLLAGDKKRTKITLLKYLKESGHSVLPRFAGEMTGVEAQVPAADGAGWLFLRIKEMKSEFSKSELSIVQQKLEKTLDALFKERQKEGLIVNRLDETWIDTHFRQDQRDGARIEIQALTLAMLEFLGELKGQTDPREDKLKEQVRKQFWNKKFLKDGSNDATIRPNPFIAAYAYPNLLRKKEWEQCFDSALKALWLDWGGLSSIDKKHELFTPKSTGENIQSYHRGDSWYWINNIAAIAMHRLNPKKYSEQINKIVKASTHEQLSMGISGCCAETSSASIMESGGCQNQLWSNATLIELLKELNK